MTYVETRTGGVVSSSNGGGKKKVAAPPAKKAAARPKKAPAPIPEHPRYGAHKISEPGGQVYYQTSIPIEDLYAHCFALRRADDSVEGFQRVCDEKRANEIAAYLSDAKNSIPLNLVLSAQPEAEFDYDRATKMVAFKRVPKAFMVIDGQHRLLGYERAKLRRRVPLSIYVGLPRAEEARSFIDINTKQRGVSAALLLDIKQLAQVESLIEAELRALFDKLATDADSPLRDLMSADGATRGRITRVTFNANVRPMLPVFAKANTSLEWRFAVFRNYFAAILAELPEDKKPLLTRAWFFGAVLGVMDDVTRVAHATHGNLKIPAMRDVVGPLVRLNLAPLGGKPTKLSAVETMRGALPTTAAEDVEV